MGNRITVCFAACCLLMSHARALAEVSLKDFSRFDEIDQAQISPDGAYVALRVPIDDQFGLMIVDLAQHKVVKKFSVGALRSVASYVWAGSNRLVVSAAQSLGSLEQPSLTGELLGINVDGSGARYLYGVRGPAQTGTMIQQGGGGDTDAAFLIRSLPDDPGHVMIKIEGWDRQIDSNQSMACRMDVQSGRTDQCVTSPIVGTRSGFGVDDSGFIRYVVGDDVRGRSLTYARSPDHPDWQLLNNPDDSSTEVSPMGFSNDNRIAYLLAREDGDHLCLTRQDLSGGPRVKLSCDGVADLQRTVSSFDGNEPVAAVYESGAPSVRLLDTDNPARKVIKLLEDAFPGQLAVPVSHTRDGSKVVVSVYSDRNPGEYYLFDTKTLHAEYLIASRDWIDARQMAERRAISYPARDGRTIYGYLTLPPGKDPKSLPLVVVPHGGPFWLRVHWRWDSDAQMLASRGYAVLQVNFRGSGGYGLHFIEEGRQSWDHVMIDDITDGTRWAVAQGYADPRRLCIFGGSYGGYAAVMSVVREPDLYRCAIGYAGVYDLIEMRKTTDIVKNQAGRNYFEGYVGTADERLKAASPLTSIDKLKAAIMIVHGKEDRRAPFTQALELRDALDQRHYPYEWLAKAGEGHGFYGPDNRTELYEKIIAFLDKNIGPGANLPPVPPPPSDPATPAGAATAAASTPATPADPPH